MTQQTPKRRRPPAPYETFIQEQEIPILGGVGLHDLGGLMLAPWKRMGGRGAFIQMDGMEGVTGMYAVEVPAGGALSPERHLYEELIYVAEGRGTTEVWREGNAKRQVFEWQRGSLFSPPVNAWHRMVNATSSPALLLALTNAPWIMDMFRNREFIFDNSFDFSDRYDGSDDYFAVREIERDPYTGRAVRYSNVIPDVMNCELPLDDQRGPGYRFVAVEMVANTLGGHIAEFPSGRYSKAHAHFAGAVLICLRGKGYSITWPSEFGIRPWEAGLGDYVKRQDYVPGGLVSPGTGWFHQHLSVGKEPLRMLALRYGNTRWSAGFVEAQIRAGANLDIKKGGRTIEYRDEDPRIRQDYKAALAKESVAFAMPEEAFR